LTAGACAASCPVSRSWLSKSRRAARPARHSTSSRALRRARCSRPLSRWVYPPATFCRFTPSGPRRKYSPASAAECAAAQSRLQVRVRNIAKVLRSAFGKSAHWTLNDSPVRLLLTAMGANKHPWYFVRDNARNSQYTGGLSLVDCATASAAAPTYFDAWYVSPSRKGLVGWCFDGGVGVTGNPVYQACVEAFEYDDFTPANTQVVSLGTGYYPAPNAVNPPRGFLPTLTWTIDSLLAAPHDQQTQIVNRHYPGILQRFDWALPVPVDMADTSAIPTLVTVGKAAAAQMDWGRILSGEGGL
jgi:hypothetical protein